MVKKEAKLDRENKRLRAELQVAPAALSDEGSEQRSCGREVMGEVAFPSQGAGEVVLAPARSWCDIGVWSRCASRMGTTGSLGEEDVECLG